MKMKLPGMEVESVETVSYIVINNNYDYSADEMNSLDNETP